MSINPNEKTFYCPDCGEHFDVEVEPDQSLYPCPYCDNPECEPDEEP